MGQYLMPVIVADVINTCPNSKLRPSSIIHDWVIPIVETIPRDAYKYVQNGYESDDSINFMIVIEDGADEQELMKSPVWSSDKTLAAIGRAVCTPGIWPSFDSAFYLLYSILREAVLTSRQTGLESPQTFWRSSQGVTSSLRLKEWNGVQAKDV